MKNAMFLLSALLVAGAAFAAGPSGSHAATKASMKTHVVEAQVVSTDVQGKTITVKDEKGMTTTAKVDPQAAGHLKNLKAGEKVRLTCRDNDKGEHEAITHIVVEKATAKK
jgi:FtsP/CotA-like multicopper oxidase with cupredoxin domain